MALTREDALAKSCYEASYRQAREKGELRHEPRLWESLFADEREDWRIVARVAANATRREIVERLMDQARSRWTADAMARRDIAREIERDITDTREPGGETDA